MNTLKDLLRDLAIETIVDYEELDDTKSTEDIVDELSEKYHGRFIKEISKYFEWEEK